MSFLEKIDLYCIILNKEYTESSLDGIQFKVTDSLLDIQQLQPLFNERGEKYHEIVKARLGSGNFLCFSFVDTITGKPIYVRWLRTDTFIHDRYKKKITLGSDEAFTMDSYTLNNYRGKGFHAEMNKRMLNYCSNILKLKKVYMVIFSGDEFMHLHKTVKELGYVKIDSVTRLNTGFVRHFFSRIKKYVQSA